MAEKHLNQQTPLHAIATALADQSATPGRYLFGMLLIPLSPCGSSVVCRQPNMADASHGCWLPTPP
jgi:hypothetical protein